MMKRMKLYALGLAALLVFNTACAERDENGEIIAIKTTNFVEESAFDIVQSPAFKFEPTTEDYSISKADFNYGYDDYTVEGISLTLISYDSEGKAIQFIKLDKFPTAEDAKQVYEHNREMPFENQTKEDFILWENYVFENASYLCERSFYKQEAFTKKALSPDNVAVLKKEADRKRNFSYFSKPYITQKQKDAVDLEY